MKTLEFDNEEIEKVYKSYAVNHPGLSSVIKIIKKEYGNLKVMDVISNVYDAQIIIDNGKGLINIYLDFLKRKIKVSGLNKKSTEVYDDLYKNKPIPDSYEYENEDKVIIKKKVYNLENDKAKKLHYVIFNKKDGNQYTMIVTYTKLKYDEQDFINYLLNNCDTTSIRTLFLSLSKYLNSSLFDIKITDNKGCIVNIKNGVLAKYVEYIENEEKYSKVYLENDDFYINRIVKEKCNDESIRLIKEIGGVHGKEKK